MSNDPTNSDHLQTTANLSTKNWFSLWSTYEKRPPWAATSDRGWRDWISRYSLWQATASLFAPLSYECRAHTWMIRRSAVLIYAQVGIIRVKLAFSISLFSIINMTETRKIPPSQPAQWMGQLSPVLGLLSWSTAQLGPMLAHPQSTMDEWEWGVGHAILISLAIQSVWVVT